MGAFGKTLAIISLIINAILAIVAVMTYIDNKKLKVDIEERKQEVISKNKEFENERQLYQELYQESLRKYASTYGELLKAGSVEIGKYDEFLNDWGPREFPDPDRFRVERTKQFNKVKGKMDAIIDHVNRYKRILVPFSRSLNGRIERMRDALAADDEDSIQRIFIALESGVTSQTEALEEELKTLSGGR